MLLRFRVANHRSIRDEQTLSLVGVPRRGEQKPRASDVPRTVPVAGIYGANASGKSNVLDALIWMVTAIDESHGVWTPDGNVPRRPFKLDLSSPRRPSFYELDFLYDGIRYSYGFEVDDAAVQSEWLFSFPHGRPRQLINRPEPQNFQFSRSLGGQNARIARLTRPNSLYLSSAAYNNHPLLGEIFHRLTRGINEEFDTHLRMLQTKLLLHRKHTVNRVIQMLRIADLGLVGAEFKSDEDIIVHHTASGGTNVAFDMDDESAGTKEWLSLIGPLLETLDRGDVLVVDEIDASLHPQLSSSIIRMFKDPEINRRGAQLIFASHDTTLLGSMIDDHILNRDEVWFTEKDNSGATTLYALAEFHPRKDENVERGYLQGRYGAVPYLSFDKLREIFREEESKPDEPKAQPPAPRPAD